jgi:hypothetical protein
MYFFEPVIQICTYNFFFHYSLLSHSFLKVSQ